MDSRSSVRSPLPWRGLLALTAVAAALRFVGLSLSDLWLDEAFEVAAASAPLGDAILVETNQPPLHRLLLALWIRVLGDSDAAVRSLAALAGTLTVPALFALADHISGRRAAWLAGALAAVSPYLIYYSREARGYSLLVLLAVLSALAWLAWTRDDRPRARIAWAAIAVLGLHTHYFFAFVLLAQAADLVSRPDRGRRLRESMPAVVAVVVLFSPWAIHTLSHLAPQDRSYVHSALGNVAVTLFRFATGYGLFVLDAETLAAEPRDQILQALPAALAAVLVFAPPLVLGIRTAWPDRDRGGRLIVLTLLVPVVLLLALSPVIPLLHDRYLAFAAPAFLLLVTIGIRSLARMPHTATVLAALALGVSLAGDARELLDDRCRKEDWRAAARTVAANEKPGDVVVLSPHYLHFAFDREYRGNAVRGSLCEPGPETTRAWLVVRETDGMDAVRGFLERRGEPRGQWRFTRHWGIRVYLFGPRDAGTEDRR